MRTHLSASTASASIRRWSASVWRRWQEHYVDVLLLVCGLTFLVVGLVERAAEQPIAGGVNTTGRIVGHVNDSEPGSTDRHAVIEFRDDRERLHRFTSPSSGVLVDGEVGEVVSVRYDPADPSRAQWADQPGQGLWWLVSGAGVILLVVEIALVARRVIRGRTSGDRPPNKVLTHDRSPGPRPVRAGPDPDRLPDLFTEPVLVVEQTNNGLDDVYRVATEDGNEVGAITSADQRPSAKLLRFFDKDTLSSGAAALVVSDRDGGPLLSIERYFLGKNRSIVRGSDGATIVELVQENSVLQAPRFSVHAEGRQVATIVLDTDFIVSDDSGRELARASETGRRWRRFHVASGVYAISSSPDAPDPLSRIARAALLSVVVTFLDADATPTM